MTVSLYWFALVLNVSFSVTTPPQRFSSQLRRQRKHLLKLSHVTQHRTYHVLYSGTWTKDCTIWCSYYKVSLGDLVVELFDVFWFCSRKKSWCYSYQHFSSTRLWSDNIRNHVITRRMFKTILMITSHNVKHIQWNRTYQRHIISFSSVRTLLKI